MTWAILKTDEKIEIYGDGKVTRTVFRYGSNQKCQDTWWGAKKPMRFFKVSEEDTVTARYRALKESMCPPTYPFVYNFGLSCCKSDHNEKGAGLDIKKADSKDQYLNDFVVPCDSGPLQFDTYCCAGGKFTNCKEPPCTDYVYHDLEDAQHIRSCRHRKYDPYGTKVSQKWRKSYSGRPCARWSDISAPEHWDDHMGLGFTNVCKNPDLDEKGPWCYVRSDFEEKLVMESCNVPFCTEETEDDFTDIDDVIQPTDEAEERGSEGPGSSRGGTEINELMRLYHPTLSEEYTFGYHGGVDAIDGNFSTFAFGFSDITHVTFEAWFSYDRRGSFVVHQVVVYTHAAFQDTSNYKSSYYDEGLEVILYSDNPNKYSPVLCRGDKFKPGHERYVFICDLGHFRGKAFRSSGVAITNANIPGFPLALREVEVYGYPAATAQSEELPPLSTLESETPISDTFRNLKIDLDRGGLLNVEINKKTMQIKQMKFVSEDPTDNIHKPRSEL